MIGIVVATAGAVKLVQYSTVQQAHMDCSGYAQEAAQYPNFYLLAWQKEECQSIGVTINAPVR